MMNDARGSIWRKWDLHVHTRQDKNYTCLGESSLTPEQISELIKITGLSKAQVTSQEKELSSENYVKLLIAYLETFTDLSAIAITNHNSGKDLDYLIGKIQKISFFPGVEVSSSHGIHIVCIFDPDVKWKDTWENSIDDFLTQIGIIGQRFDSGNNPLSAPKTSQNILETVKKLNGICIFAHIQTENGLFKQSDTASGGTAHSDIYTHKLCNIVQLPSNAPLRAGVSNIIEGRDASYGGKTVTKIKCSDARKLTDIGRDFTWIKADPTFEGLKQIIYEPKERVKIQVEDPSESETYAKIGTANIQLPSDLKIKDELGEVTEFCIRGNYDLHFSNNLTCIIGGRGSGKSTIAHLIYNSQNQEAEKLRNIDSPLINLVLSPSPLKVVADKTDCEIPTQTESFFQNEIEQAAKNVKQMSDLIRRRLERLSSIQGESLEGKRADWNKSADAFDVLIDAYDQIAYLNSQILSAENSIKILIKQTQVITSDEYKSYLDEIDVLMRAVNSFVIYEQEYALLAKRISALKTTIDTLEWNENQGKNVLIKLKSKLEECERELSKRYVACKEAYIAEGAKTNLDKKKELLKNYLKNKGLAPENVQELANANQEINELRQRITRLNLEKQPFLKIYQEKTQIIKDYDSAYRDYRNALSGAASLLYSTLSNLQSTQKEITFDVIADETELKRQICDFVKRMLKDETILRADVIERVIFANGNSQEYAAESNKIREQVNQSTVAEKHTEILKELINDDVFLERLHLRVVKYYFDINNLRVQTKLGGTLLKNTSFGERCGIAIAIILAAGTNPVLIDQPEDHLDGKFISMILVPLIRKQKYNRQIILITRDANIVIGGDTELIHILESAEQRTEICPSTIENTDKRESYIWILDGGEDAFRKREQKYDFSGTTS